MTSADRWRGVLAGALAGFTGGLFGVGGGVVLIPLLTGRFHLGQHRAHGTSLAVIGATALASLAVYGGGAHVAWRVALIVGLASAIAAPLGARLATRLSPRRLRLAFALFLALVAIRLLWHVPEAGAARPGAVPEWAVDLATGAAMGLLAGFMGVGGGILAVPAFTLLLGLPQVTAQGTSLAVILVTAPAGAIEHHRQRNVAWTLAPWLALGAALGAPPAATLAVRLPHVLLARLFAAFLVVTAARIAWQARCPAPVPGPARA